MPTRATTSKFFNHLNFFTEDTVLIVQPGPLTDRLKLDSTTIALG